MEFLLKKNKGGGPKSTTIQEVAKKLEIASLTKRLNTATQEITELKKLPKQKTLEDLFDKKFMASGNPVDLTNAPSIEKNDKIKTGVAYFNSKTDKLRLKTKAGWVTIIVE